MLFDPQFFNSIELIKRWIDRNKDNKVKLKSEDHYKKIHKKLSKIILSVESCNKLFIILNNLEYVMD